MNKTPMDKAATDGSQPSDTENEKIQKGIVNAVVYAGNTKLCDTSLEEAGAWAKKPGHIVWIGLYEPDEIIFSEIKQQFNLHPLAVEDAQKKHQRTKVEQYGDSLFIVARTAERVHKRITLHETHIFAGKGYVITIRHNFPVGALYRQLTHWLPAVHAKVTGTRCRGRNHQKNLPLSHLNTQARRGGLKHW